MDSTISPAMRNILVTGSDGMLGWHLRCRLFARPECDVVSCTRQQFNDAAWLRAAVQEADAVVHLAGINRASESELEQGNTSLSKQLVAACEATDSRPHVLYSSSVHADNDTPYGRGKRKAARILSDWAEREDARFCNIVLPHVFGEHGKPFYNSVVSTFAWQLANDQQPEIQSDGLLSLLHTSDVARLVQEKIDEGFVGTVRPRGTDIRVTSLLDRIGQMVDRYNSGVVPQLDQPLDLQLFNTFRSHLPAEHRRIPLKLHTDHRGSLFETIRSDGQGQVFLSTTAPGITRGNHFHTRKVERFVVVEGRATIRLRRMLTDEVTTFDVAGSRPEAIDIPTLHTHNITNTGDTPLLTLFWTGELFDPADPDTFACDVASEANRA